MKLISVLTLLLMGCADQDSSKDQVDNTNNAIYMESNDRYGNLWYQFKSDQAYCIGRVGHPIAECRFK